MHELHTAIHSLGPGSGTTGLNFTSPNAADLVKGTWPMWPSVFWPRGNSDTKVLFACRVGDDPEFRVTGGSTIVRRAMTVHMSLIFIGGYHEALQEFRVTGKTYAAGSGTLIYGSPPLELLAEGWSAVIPIGGNRDTTVDDDMLRYSLAHPFVLDTVNAVGPNNLHRRNNLMGLWGQSKKASIRRRMIHVAFDIFDFDAARADPSVLSVEIQPVTSGAFVGDRNVDISATRCFVAGWCVTSKEGGPPLTVGV